MARISGKGFFIIFAVLMLILGGLQTAAAFPPLPMSVNGTVTIDGKVAPEGSKVAAVMDGVSVDEWVISLSGEYMLEIPGEYEDTDKTVTFLVNGVDTQHSEKWESGSVVSIDLSIITSTSSASYSYSEPSIESDEANVSDTEVEQVVSDTEELDNVSHDLQSSSDPSSASPLKSLPGFNLSLSAGIIICYMILNGKRDQDDD